MDNDPISVMDAFGLATFTAGKCEIVIAYGHGSRKKPHKFKFTGGCSAGTFVGCYSKTTNDGIPEQNRVPGAPSTDDELCYGGDCSQDPDTSFSKYVADSKKAAEAQAKAMCKGGKCDCKEIKITLKLADEGFFNWATQPSYDSYTVKCEGK